MSKQYDFLTVEQVAELCNVSPGTVRAWQYAKRIPYYKLGGTAVRFQRSDVLDWIEKCKREAGV